jgi:glutamine amidotransferase
MLAVIDYGAGNLRSVLHALHHLGATNIQLVHSPTELHGARQIILPGVGAFGAGMEQLKRQDLIEPLKAALNAGIPYLGICLGMQFLFEASDEMGQHEGLGLLSGHVTRFPESSGFKVPHMGWNNLQIERPTPLFADLPAHSSTYFVHSYYCAPANRDDIIASVNYSIDFAAAVARDNIYGVQFHPEKSQRTGLRILSNFLEMDQ